MRGIVETMIDEVIERAVCSAHVPGKNERNELKRS